MTLVDLPSARGGGAERIAAMITARLDPSRFERTMCATRYVRHPHPDIEASGTRLLVLKRRSALSLASWRPLVSLLRRERIDIVHAHMFGSNFWGSLLGRLTGVPVVLSHEHTWAYDGDRVRTLVDREVIGRLSTLVLTVSQLDRTRMIAHEGLRPDKVVYVQNGIPPLPAPTGKDVRAELGIAPDAPLAVSISMLRAQKALDVLLAAAVELRSRLPHARVLIVGDGPERETLAALVRELELEDMVLLTGRRSDVADVLAAADVAVSSSAFEGSPLAIMEYMAAGKPVVATRVGGVPDLIDDGVEGLLVEPGDPQALAGALERVLTAPDVQASMGAAGQDRQRREFDLDVMVRRLERLYERLYAASDRGRREGWAPVSAD